ncbi:unnamed protein product [Linum trigynum]|uniref:Uncharacterized protein n=1 Tax=Linum trigynum TaxID=586398 RepID=A0AAV2DU81_9ROSI
MTRLHLQEETLPPPLSTVPMTRLLARGAKHHVHPPDRPLCWRCSYHQYLSSSAESGEGNVGGDDDLQVDKSAEQFIGKMRAMNIERS